MNNITKPILFFDGVCGLCNHSVDFLIRIDKNNKLQFATLQGVTSKKILEPKYLVNLDTVSLYLDNETYTRSTAVLKSLIIIGNVWTVFGVFLIIPKFIRDWLYLRIAKNRYHVFGKTESCRIPTKEEREKILL